LGERVARSGFKTCNRCVDDEEMTCHIQGWKKRCRALEERLAEVKGWTYEQFKEEEYADEAWESSGQVT